MGDRQRGIVWFRRDLRLADNRTLRRALDECDEIVPLFVVDGRLWNGGSANRRWFLAGCLADLDEQLEQRTVVCHGDPTEVITSLMNEHGIDRLYRAADCAPHGRRRDAEVDDAVLGGGGETVVVDQPYAAPLDAIRTGQGEPYKVFTAYWRRWQTLDHGDPRPRPRRIPTVEGVESDGTPDGGEPSASAWRPEPGERAGHRVLDRYLAGAVDEYARERDSPADDSTSRLGAYLKFGCIHPRQILARLDMRNENHSTFASELAWRDFYASVLHAWPDSAWSAWNPAMSSIELDSGVTANRRFDAWCEGRTGYPLVDAGMRQLVAEGFMHNRVRMVTASFLVKDLHVDWTRGARFFLDHLYDGDLASNNHGWQWVAGTGTDAAPYFRVFNPVRQSERFDPEGTYIRRWAPELAGIDNKFVHAPWTAPDGPPEGYPQPIVDHGVEREEALRRLAALG